MVIEYKVEKGICCQRKRSWLRIDLQYLGLNLESFCDQNCVQLSTTVNEVVYLEGQDVKSKLSEFLLKAKLLVGSQLSDFHWNICFLKESTFKTFLFVQIVFWKVGCEKIWEVVIEVDILCGYGVSKCVTQPWRSGWHHRTCRVYADVLRYHP